MSRSPEEIAARWLGGRGTKVIYSAVLLAIIGTLMTAGSLSSAREVQETSEVEIQKAIGLAVEVQDLCADREFKSKNAVACEQAAELLNPSPTSIPGGGTGSDEMLVEAFGIPR